MIVVLQYYYNSFTQQYLYWDSEKQAYMPATDYNSTASSSTTPVKEGKEKKEKPKSKTAQQVAFALNIFYDEHEVTVFVFKAKLTV